MLDSEIGAYEAYARIQALLGTNIDTPSLSMADNMHVSSCPKIEHLPDRSLDNTRLNQNVVSGVSTNSNVESSKKLHSDETAFHELIQQSMHQKSDAVCGVQAVDNIAQAEIAGRYAFVIQNSYIELAQEARRYGIEHFSNYDQTSTSWRGCQLQGRLSELRAERDLWSLLEILTASNLMYDLKEHCCEEKLQRVLSSLSITASIPEYINAAYTVDDRLKKGAVMKEWIEKAAADQVSEAPVARGNADPWGDSLARLLKSKASNDSIFDSSYDSNNRGIGGKKYQITNGNTRNQTGSLSPPWLVPSMHPDAQITEDAKVLPLDGVDRLDQECLLRSIWQLLRCGNIVRAQELAAEHRVYWLAASLQGIASHYYKPVVMSNNNNNGRFGNNIDSEYNGSEEGISPATTTGYGASKGSISAASESVVGIARVGNLKQPIWMRTCWNHSNRLAEQPSNWNCQLHQQQQPEHQQQQQHRTTSSTTIVVRDRNKGGGEALLSSSLAGVLEMTIYAVLSNNTKVLLKSPLVSSWQDKLWVYLKAVHERDLLRIVHRYRSVKNSHSTYYPGCDEQILKIESEMLELGKIDMAAMSTANCMQIFHKIPPPSATLSDSTAATTTSTSSKDAEALILGLQAAVMEGRSGIQNYIDNTMVRYLLRIQPASLLLSTSSSWSKYDCSSSSSTDKNSSSSNSSDALLLRIFCHFCIWCKYAHQEEENSCGNGEVDVSARLSSLVSDEVFYLSVEKYIDHLIETKQRSLVAAYAAYLSKPRRIYKYAQLLRATDTTTTSSSSLLLLSQEKHLGSNQTRSDAAEVLQLANIFFPLDVIEITRHVVEGRPTASYYTTTINSDDDDDIGTADFLSTPAAATFRGASSTGRGVTTPFSSNMMNGTTTINTTTTTAAAAFAPRSVRFSVRDQQNNDENEEEEEQKEGHSNYDSKNEAEIEEKEDNIDNDMKYMIEDSKNTITSSSLRLFKSYPVTPRPLKGSSSVGVLSLSSSKQAQYDSSNSTAKYNSSLQAEREGFFNMYTNDNNITTTTTAIGSSSSPITSSPGNSISALYSPNKSQRSTTTTTTAATTAGMISSTKSNKGYDYRNRMMITPQTSLQRKYHLDGIVADGNDVDDDASNAEKDQIQMDSLRWVYFDSSHRIEAIKQTNRVIVRFLLDYCNCNSSTNRSNLKINQVRKLLSDYIPLDSITVGCNLLLQRRAEVEDIQALYAYERSNSNRQQQQEEVEVDRLLMREQDEEAERQIVSMIHSLELDERLWEAQVAKLHLWHGLTTAMQDVDMFYASVSEFESAAKRLIGVGHSIPSEGNGVMMMMHNSSLSSFRARIVRAAATATNAIMQALTCSSSSSKDSVSGINRISSNGSNVSLSHVAAASSSTDGVAGAAGATTSEQETSADGYRDIWTMSENSANEFISTTVIQLTKRLTTTSSSNSNISTISSRDWGEIYSALCLLIDSAQELYRNRDEAVSCLFTSTTTTTTTTTIDSQEQQQKQQQHPVLVALNDLLSIVQSICNSSAAAAAAAAALLREKGDDIASSFNTSLSSITPIKSRVAALATPHTSSSTTYVSNRHIGSNSNDEESLFILNSIQQCQQYIDDNASAAKLAAAVLFKLLSSYTQVCVNTARILEKHFYTALSATQQQQQHLPNISNQNSPQLWYCRAMRLADLIATEDHSLQLYTLLHRTQLESLLSGINSAAMSLLAIDPDMASLSSCSANYLE